MSKTINLEKLCRLFQTDERALADSIFASHKFPLLALARIKSGATEWREVDIRNLADRLGVTPSELFEINDRETDSAETIERQARAVWVVKNDKGSCVINLRTLEATFKCGDRQEAVIMSPIVKVTRLFEELDKFVNQV